MLSQSQMQKIDLSAITKLYSPPPHLTSFTLTPASNSSRVTPPDASWSSERIRWASSVSDGGAPSFR